MRFSYNVINACADSMPHFFQGLQVLYAPVTKLNPFINFVKGSIQIRSSKRLELFPGLKRSAQSF